MQIKTSGYAQLLINNTPLLDVRAPVEFTRGAFPNTFNLPLLDDLQREIIGTCYKQQGQEKAIEKGHELVSGKLKEARIAAWVTFAKQHPNASLYCFRGGLRSNLTQQWMKQAGAELPLVEGGYKALRTYLLEELDHAASACSIQLIGGRTGSAKTELINQLDNGVDLEGAAHHRGSSFGSHAVEQNTQINFENILAIDLLKLRHKHVTSIVLEDEGRTIGRAGIPKPLYLKMRSSPIVVVEMPFDVRLERLIQEYVVDMHKEFQTAVPVGAFDAFSDYLLAGLERISKRLGSEQYGLCQATMLRALERQKQSDDINMHYDWLAALLKHYYDPAYEYALNKRKEFITFRGTLDECRAFLQTT